MKTWPPKKLPPSIRVFRKYDGVQVQIKVYNRSWTAVTRTGHSVTHRIRPHLEAAWPFDDSEIIGELYYGDDHNAHGAVAACNWRSGGACEPEFKFAAFDVEWFDCSKEIFQTRWQRLGDRICTPLANGHVLCAPWFHKVESLYYSDNRSEHESAVQQAFDLVLREGGEGVVIRDMITGDAWKKKRRREVDVVLRSYDFGKGKYEFTAGRYHMYVGDRYLGNVGTGVTDEIREQFRRRMEAGEEIVVEIGYDSVDSKGKLRQPRILRERLDKLPGECMGAELEE